MAKLAIYSDPEKKKFIQDGTIPIGSLYGTQLEKLIDMVGEDDFRKAVSRLTRSGKLDLTTLDKKLLKTLALNRIIKMREIADAEGDDEVVVKDMQYEENVPTVYTTQGSLKATNKEWAAIKRAQVPGVEDDAEKKEEIEEDRRDEPIPELPVPPEKEEVIDEEEKDKELEEEPASITEIVDEDELEELTKEFYGIPTKRNLRNQKNIRVPFARVPDSFAKKKHINSYDIDTLESAYKAFYGDEYESTLAHSLIEDMRKAKKDLHSSSLSKMKAAPNNFLWAARKLSSLCTFDIDIERVNFDKIENWAKNNKKINDYAPKIQRFKELKERIRHEGISALSLEDKKDFANFVAQYEADLHKDIVKNDAKLKEFYDMYLGPVNTVVGGLAMGYLLAVPKNIASPQGAILLCMSVGGVPVVSIMAGLAVASIAINLGIKIHKKSMDNRKKRGNNTKAIRQMHRAMPRTRRKSEADLMNDQDLEVQNAIAKKKAEKEKKKTDKKTKKALTRKNKKLSGLEKELEGLTNEQIVKKLSKHYISGNRMSRRVANQVNKNMLFFIEKAALQDDDTIEGVKGSKLRSSIESGKFVTMYKALMNKALKEEREGKKLTDLRTEDVKKRRIQEKAKERKAREEASKKDILFLTEAEDARLDGKKSNKIRKGLNTRTPKEDIIDVDSMEESALKQKLLKAKEKALRGEVAAAHKQAKKNIAPKVKEHLDLSKKSAKQEAKGELTEISKNKHVASDGRKVGLGERIKTETASYLKTFVNGTGKQGRKDLARARLNKKEDIASKKKAVEEKRKQAVAEASKKMLTDDVINSADRSRNLVKKMIENKTQSRLKKVIKREERKVKLLQVPPKIGNKAKTFYTNVKSALASKTKSVAKTKKSIGVTAK